MTKRNVVITAPDITPTGYSGMGLRALGIASALQIRHSVAVLAAGRPDYLPSDALDVRVGHSAHREALEAADVVITANGLRAKEILRLRAAIVSDLYDPSYFEWLVLPPDERHDRRPWALRQARALRQSLSVSQAVLCANERQRDLYLGALLGSEPLPQLFSYEHDAIARRVLVVPNGVSASERLPDRSEARGRLGFANDDVVLLWAGGVWDWMDAETVLRACLEAHAADSRIRLVFLGLRRGETPDPHATRAQELLGPYTRQAEGATPVRVNERWVGPRQRLDYLAAADASVLGQFSTLETHFSFRTRFMDCLQAGLPVIGMDGDFLSQQASRQQWGLITPIGDQRGLTENILRFATQPHLRQTMRRRASEAASHMTWERQCSLLTETISSLDRLDTRQRLYRAHAVRAAAVRGMANNIRKRLPELTQL